MSRIILSVFILTLFITLNCSSNPLDVDAQKYKVIESLPRELTSAETEIIGSVNTFALKLLKEINTNQEPNENIFISPLSVSYALGMTYNGADGETKDAIANTLDFSGLPENEINDSYRSLTELLTGLDNNVEFSIANSIWYRNGFSVEQPFLKTCSDFFLAEVAGLDFNQPSAVSTINTWVVDATNGKITDLVTPPINPLTVMYLINAIYFNGNWTTQFEPENNTTAAFSLVDGSSKSVDMMNMTEFFLICSGSNFEMLEMPYGGEAFSMMILMPNPDTDINTLITGLTYGDLEKLYRDESSRETIISVPKFKLKYELEMNDVLKALGMEIAFSQGEADFSRINPSESLFISKVKHKSFVDVNEVGTEAAAATSVEVSLTSAPYMFTVNRPFIFLIREKFSNTILFMGKIVEPVIE